MIVMFGLSCRAVSAISTAVSSRSTAMISWAARWISALARTSRRVASPVTPTTSARFASAVACGRMSITTTSAGVGPASSSVLSVLRPFVPYPTSTVCPDNLDLHRDIRQLSRVRSVSTSSVVPISRIRKTTLIGVITNVLTSRAVVVIGTMSP